MVRRWLHTVVVAVLVLATLGGVAITVGGETPSQQAAAAIDATAAQTDDFDSLAPRGRWNPARGSGELILDNESYYPVFQGESDVETWRDTSGADVTGTLLEGEAGQSEGEVLDLSSSVPADQAIGRYSGEDLTVRVREPSFTSVDLYNSIGTELDDIAELQRTEPLLVVVDWNYVAAEDLQVALVDRDDDITVEREALSTVPTGAQADRLPAGFDNDTLARDVQGLGTTGYRSAYWLFDVAELDEGSYTLRIEGVDDLTTGEAVETIQFSIGSAATPTATRTPTATATPSPTPTASPSPTTTAEPTSSPATATSSPTAQPTTTETPTPTAGADGPGFGPLLTLVALTVALLVARRSYRR